MLSTEEKVLRRLFFVVEDLQLTRERPEPRCTVLRSRGPAYPDFLVPFIDLISRGWSQRQSCRPDLFVRELVLVLVQPTSVARSRQGGGLVQFEVVEECLGDADSVQSRDDQQANEGSEQPPGVAEEHRRAGAHHAEAEEDQDDLQRLSIGLVREECSDDQHDTDGSDERDDQVECCGVHDGPAFMFSRDGLGKYWE